MSRPARPFTIKDEYLDVDSLDAAVCKILTVSVHVDVETFAIPARLALVSPCHVHHTLPTVTADVGEVTPYAPLEETPASIATVHAIVAPRAPIAAHLARDVKPAVTPASNWLERRGELGGICGVAATATQPHKRRYRKMSWRWLLRWWR